MITRATKLLSGFLLSMIWTSIAVGANTLDVKSMLTRPGVRLVAVEFYATWCKPCMEAIPRWNELHKKYYDQGLRLIVINTQDPNGLCGSPGWTPDEMVCDIDGALAERMGARELPSAYLWSWQGNLLVERGHIDKVEKAIESYFQTNPRVLVEAENKGAEGRYLANLARSELARTGKFTVVASAAEQRLAAEIRKKSFEATKSKDTRCKLGEELAANSLLKVGLRNNRLYMQLYSAESSCLLEGAGVRYNLKNPEGSMAEVVAKLLAGSARINPQMPGGGDMQAMTGTGGTGTVEDFSNSGRFREEVKEFEGSSNGFFFIKSKPEGATIRLNGEVIGQTPLQVLKPPRSYVVSAELDKRYFPYRERVEHSSNGTRLTIELKPNFGPVEIITEPPGVNVRIDGALVGKTPYRNPETIAGNYQYRLESEGYLSKLGTLSVKAGKPTIIQETLERNSGTLVIESDPPGATVRLGDKLLPGRTPLTQRHVTAGAHLITLEKPGYGSVRGRQVVKRGETVKFAERLEPRLGQLVVLAKKIDGKPCEGEVFIDGASVGISPWSGPLLALEHEVKVSCATGRGTAKVLIQEGKSHTETVTVAQGPISGFRVEVLDQETQEPLSKTELFVNRLRRDITKEESLVQAGRVNFSVRSPGYGSFTFNEDLRPNQSIDLRLEVLSEESKQTLTQHGWIKVGSGAGVAALGGLLLALRPSQSDVNQSWTQYYTIAGNGASQDEINAAYAETEALSNRHSWLSYSAYSLLGIGLASTVWGAWDIIREPATWSFTVGPRGAGVGVRY